MLNYSPQSFAQVIVAIPRAESPSSCMCPPFAEPPAPDWGREPPVWKDDAKRNSLEVVCVGPFTCRMVPPPQLWNKTSAKEGLI